MQLSRLFARRALNNAKVGADTTRDRLREKPVLQGDHSQLSHAARKAKRESHYRVRLPLAEESFNHEANIEQVQEWYTGAQHQTRLEARSFSKRDDPSAEDLLRELRWLTEDALGEDWRSIGTMPAPSGMHVRSRLPLHELQELWKRRLRDRVPLQYLNNAAHWDEMVLAVGPGVLIPRPETQCLLHFASEAVAEDPKIGEGCWADLGTGSGALAIGLAKRLNGLQQVWAIDSSPDAIPWAELNVKRLSRQGVVEVRLGSWLDPLEGKEGLLCGILSNPPYIEPHIVPGLQAEVALHEPHKALDGGDSQGLACLEQICQQAGALLRPAGFLGLETGGREQAEAVLEKLKQEFDDVRIRQDMFGVERFVTAKKKYV